MQVPPEITYKGVEATPQLDNLIQRQIDRLERVCDYIVSLHVAIEIEQARHQVGNPFRVRLEMNIPPNHQIVTKKQSVLHVDTRRPVNPEEVTGKPTSITSRKDEPLPAVIRETFTSAKRQLQKLVERQQGKIKTHPANEVTAFVDKLFPDEGYGFLRSIDGQQIYFHKNSTLHGEWERLVVGTGVRYTPQQGEKGLQASSVEIVNKPGASEMHDALHELPEVTKPKLKKMKFEFKNHKS